MKTVCVLPGDSSDEVGEMFERRGYRTVTGITADIIVFTGGSDVHPSIYGEEMNGARNCDIERDMIEKGIFDYAVSSESRHPLLIGICRGGQLLNVLNDGRMIQDLGKTISGTMFASDGGEYFPVVVDHHQGMLCGEDGKLLSWIEYTVPDTQHWPDYAIWYPDTKSFCFQPHPEWDEETEDYFFKLLKTECSDGI